MHSLIPTTILQPLVRIYTNPLRKYHNLKHIQSMLRLLEECRHLTDIYDLMVAVIWFHDSVYDPESTINEIESARMWNNKMAPYVSKIQLEFGESAIIATIDHKINIDTNIQLLLDLDLSSLGYSYDEFLINSSNIREEYRHVPDEEFNVNRLKFLQKMLDRGRIYGTDYWYDRLEKSARDNISRFIKERETVNRLLDKCRSLDLVETELT